MKMRNHLIMGTTAILVWTGFYLIGIPSDYYLTWSLTEKILILLITLFAVIPCIGFSILIFLDGDYLKNSIWLALYASFGLLIPDFIVVGIIQQKGFAFFFTHWVQSCGYLQALLVMPLIGLTLEKIRKIILTLHLKT